MPAGALADGRRAVRWATDYILRAHTAPNKFYGQVGLSDLDHDFWGRPEDMTMERPAYKIDTSNPGKIASRSFLSHIYVSVILKTINSLCKISTSF
jgi:hypothetical protein